MGEVPEARVCQPGHAHVTIPNPGFRCENNLHCPPKLAGPEWGAAMPNLSPGAAVPSLCHTRASRPPDPNKKQSPKLFVTRGSSCLATISCIMPQPVQRCHKHPHGHGRENLDGHRMQKPPARHNSTTSSGGGPGSAPGAPRARPCRPPRAVDLSAPSPAPPSISKWICSETMVVRWTAVRHHVVESRC